MSKRSERLAEELRRAIQPAQDLAKSVDEAGREFTGEEKASIEASVKAAGDLRKARDEALADEKRMAELARFGVDLGIVPLGAGTTAERKGTIGEQFTSSAEFKAMLGQFHGGHIGDTARVSSAPVQYKSLFTGASLTSAGSLVQPDILGLRDFGTFQRPLRVRDAVTIGQTGSDTVEFVRVTGYTNASAPVPEATTTAAIGGGVTAALGGVKPESGLTFERVTANVKTIASWIPATKRSLSDAAQISTIIDNFSRYGLQEDLENEVIRGDGSGEHFTGLRNTSGVQVHAYDTDLLTTARTAITKVLYIGRATPTGFLMNPSDWQAFDLLKAATGQFYFGGPLQLGTQTLWGLPVVQTEAVQQGTCYVGDLRQMVIWDREQAAITATDSHNDFFIRNLVAILAELRAAFGIIRPSGIVKVALTAPPASGG
jgi:HK97 family phage major capsid protein